MAVTNINKFWIRDPRIDVQNNSFTNWYTMIGAKNCTTQQYNTTNYSNSSITFNLTLSTINNVVIDRSSAVVQIPLKIKMTCAPVQNDTHLVYSPENNSLRAYPFHKIVNTTTITLNGNSISYVTHEIIRAMERTTENEDHSQATPTYPDYFQTYTAASGSNRNPFATYQDNTTDITRGAYPIKVISNTATEANLEVILLANLYDFPPFSRNKEVMGMNMSPIQIGFFFISNLAKMWSRVEAPTGNPIVYADGNKPLTSFEVTMGAALDLTTPILTLTLLSLPDDTPIPRQMFYPYHNCVFYPVTTNLVNSDATTEVTTQLIQLNTVPLKMYIYLKKSTNEVLTSANSACNSPDVFAKINGVKITFGNKANILSSARPVDLYTISKRNGLNKSISFNDWNGYIGVDPSYTNFQKYNTRGMGSLLCLNPAMDLSVDDNAYVGVSNKVNFQCIINFTNIAPVAQTFDACVLIVYDGLHTAIDNQSNLTTTIVSDISELKHSPLTYTEMKMKYNGGVLAGENFLSDGLGKLKEAAMNVNSFLKDTKLISQGAKLVPPPYGTIISSTARALGYGNGEGGILSGGKLLKRSDVARARRGQFF
jgi:hypothetical protein